MDVANKRPALGRGLDALFGEGDVGDGDARATSTPDDTAVKSVTGDETYQVVSIDLVEPNPTQPRRYFDETDLEELSASIKENGLIQPIIVRRSPNNADLYEIVAGERRWRAAQRASLHEVPVVVRELDDREALAFAIIENVQRADLNAIEEAQGYQQLMEQFQYTQDQLADVVGKSRPHIANTLRLMRLPEEVQVFVRDGRLTAGHARAVLSANSPVDLAERAVARGWSVRQIEQAVKSGSDTKPKTSKSSKVKDADTALLEGELSLALQTTVSIQDRGPRGGDVVISYKSIDDLDRIAAQLKEIGGKVLARSS